MTAATEQRIWVAASEQLADGGYLRLDIGHAGETIAVIVFRQYPGMVGVAVSRSDCGLPREWGCGIEPAQAREVIAAMWRYWGGLFTAPTWLDVAKPMFMVFFNARPEDQEGPDARRVCSSDTPSGQPARQAGGPAFAGVT